MTTPTIKVFWCGKQETVTSERLVNPDRPPCAFEEGVWRHSQNDFVQAVTRKDYGCGWYNLNKRRLGSPTE